ncbi:hypothetical protein BDQ17DRAFT_1436472 [Cyathus striatus]|nr:hypothetical protein BDQ17DRAFT_1436472 [Cyathus striatus]
MRMHNPVPQFTRFTSTLKHTHPDLAYLRVADPWIDGIHGKTLGVGRTLWKRHFFRVFIRAGGYIRESALIRAEEKGDIIAFGRRFIANPDVVNGLENNTPLTQYDRPTFFVPAEDPNAAVRYIDYPFAKKKVEVPVKACKCSCSS